MDFTASQMYWFDKYIDKIIENNENQRLQIYNMEQEYAISNLELWAELSIVRKVGETRMKNHQTQEAINISKAYAVAP